MWIYPLTGHYEGVATSLTQKVRSFRFPLSMKGFPPFVFSVESWDTMKGTAQETPTTPKLIGNTVIGYGQMGVQNMEVRSQKH
ncbi:hypothetical protein CFP56_015010 [Quercus suber]|uniref:Uncharacterized protein n=1 Tax=Quercus suber TaxID=58331 RepID=A0AAW0KSS6_QUESU